MRPTTPGPVRGGPRPADSDAAIPGADRQSGRLLSFVLGPEADAPPIKSRVSWLLFFRILVITVLLIATVGLRAGAGQSLLGTASVVLYVVCGLSYASILLAALWLRWYPDRALVPLAYTQLVGDSIVASVLVVATGGFESAFVFLYSLSVLNAAAVLGRRASLAMAGFNSLAYSSLLGLQVGGQLVTLGLLPPSLSAVFPSFMANVLAFFLVALLSSSLTEQLRRTTQSLSEARETLVEVEEVHETVLQSLPSGVLTVGKRGRITFINRAGLDILEAPEGQVLGQAADALIPGLSADAEPERFEVTLPSERVLGGSVAELGRGGRGQVVVFQDLTELRKLQGEVARAERLKTLGRFAAGMAHELRNPLAAMIGCLQLLEADAAEGEPLSGEGARMLDIIGREATRLESLVSDFLTYARPAPPALSDVNLTELAHQCAQAAGAPEEIVVEVQAPDEPVYANCDPEQTQQILWNLVGNACQAVRGEMGQPAPGSGRVALRIERDDQGARVSVDDNGPGVQPEGRARLFEPFFTTRATGTGLGLATSHQLATSQGGDLQVARSPLGGACFTLRLPLGAPPAQADMPALPAAGDAPALTDPGLPSDVPEGAAHRGGEGHG